MLAHTRSHAATALLAFFTILSSEAFAYAPVQSVETPRRICLNVRAQARYGSAISECVPNGQQLRVLEHNPTGYSRVDLGGRTGYVWTKYLRADTPASDVHASRVAPVVATAPSRIPIPQTRPIRNALEERQTPTRERTTPRDQDRDQRTPANISQLMLATAKTLETEEIGRGQGFSLTKAVGWAKLDADGDITMKGPKRSHCTSATHAAFLKTVGELHKQGKIELTPHIRKALNSKEFLNVWNSNGYGPAKVVELLGGQNFSDTREAKPGDILKIDRTNKTGHMVIFSRMNGDKVCYWSSNRGTNGLGERCEKKGRSTFTFSRFTDLGQLQAGLNSLDSNLRVHSAFADVRRRAGHGFVRRGQLTRSADLRSPVSLWTRQAQLDGGGDETRTGVQ